MPAPRVSVLIPTRDPGPGIVSVLEMVMAQEVGFRFEVVVVDSGSAESDLDRMRGFPIALHRIEPGEFGQGRTRNLLARLSRGELLFFLSQDAQPADPGWMAALEAALDDPAVVGAYARQVPHPDADPLTGFFLAETYGPDPARRRLPPGSPALIDRIFFSNVSSAIRREVWQRIPFRDVVMSEDQWWAHDVLRAGHELAYAPRALVYHTHRYTLRSLFHRNYLSGASLKGLIADPPHRVAWRGLRYVARQATFLVRHGQARKLPYMVAYEATRMAAFGLGAWRGAG